MIGVFIIYTAFILLLTYAGADNKTTAALRAVSPEVLLFQRFKENYNRVYPDTKSEQKGYDNFVTNLATVNELNKAHNSNVVAYQLNRYADLNPETINERFGIQIIPYENMEHENEEAVKREHRHKFLEDMNLYDLHKIDELYKNWMIKNGKTVLHKKEKDIVHYYRFIKTVVETNQQKFAGNDVSLDKNADVLREPDQFFYGK